MRGSISNTGLQTNVGARVREEFTAEGLGVNTKPNCVEGDLLVAQLYRRFRDGRSGRRAQRSACILLHQYASDAVVPDTDGATAAQLLASMEQTPTARY